MYTTITESMFKDAFKELRPDNFSYASLSVLFDYYEDLEDGIGEAVELDVITICCDWGEYTIEELVSDYGHLFGDAPDNLADWEQALSDRTTVLKVDEDTLLVEAF